MSQVSKILSLIEEHHVKFVDLRFTDTRGKEQHITIPAPLTNESFFQHGKAFDGSSIAGWKAIHESDMILMPDVDTAVMDPFYQDLTLNIRCDVIEPGTMQAYERDPRGVAKRAERYLIETGIADTAYFGPEPEFFIFDDVRFECGINGAQYYIDSKEASWNSGTSFDGGNQGHRPCVKGGYFPVPPVDSAQNIRSAMALALEKMGIIVEAHHHEVATGCQNEIATQFASLTRKADEMQILKYVITNMAHAYGKTATFMPKPIVGDNGSGMHVHQSLFKNGTNLFSGDRYAGLSDTALYYMGGIIKHARALNAFTNSTTNSYKRLVPGFEAPVLLSYSACNRSAAIRVPYCPTQHTKRIEVRFPDPLSNPYLAFAALLMAGLDGIRNHIHPGDPMDKDLYELSLEETKHIPRVCHTLSHALQHLDADREFLIAGGVFTNDLIDGFIALKEAEVQRYLATTHPIEFEMYYSL